MRLMQKKLIYVILRPLLITSSAVVIACAIALIVPQKSFRNGLSDILFIEALLLFITSWLSHLKSGKLAFISFHPFKTKTYSQDWKERIPKLGSPPLPIGVTDGSSAEVTEKVPSLEEASRQEKIARRFRRDIVIAGGMLFAVGLAVQYL